MARTSTAPAPAAPAPTDPTLTSLTRLLARLSQTLLSSSAPPTLRSSSDTRTRVGANLEHARNLLLRLEHDAAAIKIQSRKQALQADLAAKRDTIKLLNQRLYELNQVGDTETDTDEDEEDERSAGRDASDSSDDDDDENAPSYAPALRDTSDTLDREHREPSNNTALHAAAENVASALRARRPQQGTSSSSSSPSSNNDKNTTQAKATGAHNPHLRAHETHMTHQRSEQETLTTSLLDMAQALKQSSMRFSASLDAEKDVLNRAGKGLDRSAEGMDSAGKRMGTLRRMTEGKGWWGRVIMYAWIGGLWILVLVIMFVLPKLRF
ncbi:uncharacterized protein K452DRAFT_247990 [Aplosporella prunicola CBS 121167]|uniref:Synaptobrevin n=1 Tax=Aplosporella prunicola CBS 121167 TaxID=1176127 RepID=A0A6A6BH22_9PEZI|nr:uncharacterized protein K452DRAFT_247990 [Aplosporella prunicola CBS 121167]KAF2143430.1 hypothetical protein K452DRAFT_247990 [Aplosporella prunicola CBS 121167]